jgi:hypothetical protein
LAAVALESDPALLVGLEPAAMNRNEYQNTNMKLASFLDLCEQTTGNNIFWFRVGNEWFTLYALDYLSWMHGYVYSFVVYIGTARICI